MDVVIFLLRELVTVQTDIISRAHLTGMPHELVFHFLGLLNELCRTVQTIQLLQWCTAEVRCAVERVEHPTQDVQFILYQFHRFVHRLN